MFTAAEAWGVVSEAAGCSSHNVSEPSFTEADIAVVFWYDYGCNCGSFSEQRKREAEEAARKLAEMKLPSSGLDDVDTFDRGDRRICGSFCDTWSETYFQLSDGRYVAASEYADTSGHG